MKNTRQAQREDAGLTNHIFYGSAAEGPALPSPIFRHNLLFTLSILPSPPGAKLVGFNQVQKGSLWQTQPIIIALSPFFEREKQLFLFRLCQSHQLGQKSPLMPTMTFAQCLESNAAEENYLQLPTQGRHTPDKDDSAFAFSSRLVF